MGTLLTVALLLAVAPAIAHGQRNERWYQVGQAADGSATWYYDHVSVKRSGADVIVWLRVELAKPDTLRDGQWSQVSLAHFVMDCGERTTAEDDYLYYGLDGKVILSRRIPNPQADPVVPGSVFENILDKLCMLTASPPPPPKRDRRPGDR